MAAVMLILKIILVLLVAMALLAFLLLSVRAGVDVVGVNGEISVDLRYGVLRIPILPKKNKLEKEKPQKTSKPKKEKKPKKYKRVFNKEELDLFEVIDIVLTILSELGSTLNISRLRARVLIGTNDAAKTGMLLGYASAFTGLLVPFFENNFRLKDYHIDIDADFDSDHTEWAFSVFCSVRPIKMLFVMLKHSGELFGLYKRLIKKVEA